MTLLRAPSLILFGIIATLFGVLREPLTAAGWPNFFTRALMERWVIQEETTNTLLRGAQLSWKTATVNLLRMAQTDTWGFLALAFVFTIAALILVLLLYVLSRSVSALIVAGRLFQTRERYTMGRAWSEGKKSWKTVGLLIIIAQLIPWGIYLVLPKTVLEATTIWGLAALVLTFLLTAFMIYGAIYRIIGEYTLGEAFRSGVRHLAARLGTTIEFSFLMLGTDIIGVTILSILGAIAIVPFLLILVILWALQWGTMFSWILIFVFALLLLYTLGSIAALLSFNYLLWVNLFYACEEIKTTSFTVRTFHALRAWWKRRRHATITP